MTVSKYTTELFDSYGRRFVGEVYWDKSYPRSLAYQIYEPDGHHTVALGYTDYTDQSENSPQIKLAVRKMMIVAKKHGMSPGVEKSVRKNPGDSRKVWICPNGEILPLPADRSWREMMPEALRTHLPRTLPDSDGINRMIYRTGNRHGFWRGAVINDRLYIHLDQGMGVEPSRTLMAKLRRTAKAKYPRGIALDHSPG
jgi:hypothetical protein